MTHRENTNRRPIAGGRRPFTGGIDWETDNGMIVIRGRAIDAAGKPVDLGFAKMPNWQGACAVMLAMAETAKNANITCGVQDND